MAPPGSRTHTKKTDIWLLPEDEVFVGQRIREVLPDAGWLCSHPGPRGLHDVHLHPSAGEALDCGSVQAFLLLPAGAAEPPGVVVTGRRPARPGLRHAAVVQLLRSLRMPGGASEADVANEADGAGESSEIFCAGRLAVRWSEPDVGPEVHRLLYEQTRLVWQALRSATLPAVVEDVTGRKVTRTRIGTAAHELVARTGLTLTYGGDERLRLSAKLPPRPTDRRRFPAGFPPVSR
ncbi:hypothetical protein [Streptomyces sp. NPDC014734]|uniref:hypothetical protein n=1 Tax=Streptomyces sp. NPDC014734 TaxID=3364886 RepID=UPI0036FF1E82